MLSRFNKLAARVPGWVWMVLCAACFSTAGALTKTLVREYGAAVLWIGLMRFGIGLSLIVTPALLGAWSLRIHNKTVWVIRGITGSCGVLLFFVSVAYVGVGVGTVLAYLMSLFGALSGIFILRERPSAAVFAGVVIGTAGVLLACNARLPQGVEWAPIGTAVLSGVTLSLVRKLRQTDSNVVAMFSQTVFGTLLLIGPALWLEAPPTGAFTWALLLLMCLIDLAGTLTMTQGLSMLPVARGGALMMLTPVFALLAGAVILGEVLTAMQTFGCALVIGASLIAILARHPTATAAAPPTAART